MSLCRCCIDANNWPLKGAKFSNWEGGTRVNALVSGGLVPPARRGAIEEGFTAIDDWCVGYSVRVSPVRLQSALSGQVRHVFEPCRCRPV